MKKTMKKITCALLASISVLGCAATASACVTSHPEVEMEIAFNGNTYTLEYTLYRNVAPATVEHFLWLAGNGYYDGLAVHDYDSTNSRMYTGAYSADADEATHLTYKDYYSVIAGYANYDKFPHSVWQMQDKTMPTYTVKGEMSNQVNAEKGELLEEKFGSLTMYYENIGSSSAAEKRVYFANSEGSTTRCEYLYNSAKSAFFISMTTNPKQNSGYCTFATLNDDSVDVLKDLQSAIEEQEDFTKEVSMTVFDDESLFNYTETKEYDTPQIAIVINKVKVNKY